jgi:hypothetical protein
MIISAVATEILWSCYRIPPLFHRIPSKIVKNPWHCCYGISSSIFSRFPSLLQQYSSYGCYREPTTVAGFLSLLQQYFLWSLQGTDHCHRIPPLLQQDFFRVLFFIEDPIHHCYRMIPASVARRRHLSLLLKDGCCYRTHVQFGPGIVCPDSLQFRCRFTPPASGFLPLLL